MSIAPVMSFPTKAVRSAGAGEGAAACLGDGACDVGTSLKDESCGSSTNTVLLLGLLVTKSSIILDVTASPLVQEQEVGRMSGMLWSKVQNALSIVNSVTAPRESMS